jgi:DNA-binding beta-propeller fold protein YncE
VARRFIEISAPPDRFGYTTRMGLLAPGTVVAGHRIESLVGRGGMGVVYRARQLDLDRLVALKVIAPELVEDEDIRTRFLAEARVAAGVEHPNVIPVHATGVEDGIAYIAMRFVAGDDLRALVRRDGALSPERAADVAAQAGAALDAIHRGGFVHRDVKPGNLLVDASGHVYLTDFGLAKQVLTQSGATRTGTWVGTLDYIAPEQIRGGRIDARADVYALGGVLHFTLTGQVPFERDRDEAKLWAQLSDPPPVPSQVCPELAYEFDAVVARAMAKDPRQRYPSAGDLGRAARAAAAGRVPAEPERMVARGAAAPDGAPTEPGLTAESSTLTGGLPATVRVRARRRRGPWLAGAAAIVAAGAVAAVLFVPDGGSPGPGATATGVAAGVAAPRGRVLQTIRNVGSRPAGIAYAGGDLWVMSPGQDRLTRIEAATGHELAQHTLIGAGGKSIVSDGDAVWVAAKRAGELLRIDARSGRITIRVRPPSPPEAIAAGPDGVWIATSAGDRLLHYDPTGRQLLGTVPQAHGVTALTLGDGAVWVAERTQALLARIDPGTGKVTALAPLPGVADALHYGGGYVWATFSARDEIARIDPASRDVVTTSGGHTPTQVITAGGRLFVASRNDHAVLVIDPRNVALLGSPVKVGLNPYALATDGRSVWVTGLENTVTRVAYG